MSIEITDWLRGLDLERYAEAFRDNDIDGTVLPRLTAEDLRELGVASVGHRRKLLDAIAALHAEPAASPAAIPALVPERRQLTVMFCDLVGSTPLATRLDPEDLREVVGTYHRVVAATVARFDGFVAKYMGDGVLIYFGYPQAREDDAERAVMSGLDLVAAVVAVNVAPDIKLACRVGIATGLVVVGDLLGTGSAQEQAVVGETPNLAARLQSLAQPDMILVDAHTHRLVGNLFEQRSLGAITIKGFAGRQRVWEILGRSRVLSRFEALRSRATPLIGREEEIELLRRRWQQAKGGDGQVVLASGEAGIGKSRLTAAFLEELASMPHTRLRYFCSPHHTDSALYPIIGQLEHAAGFVPNEPQSAKLDKIDALLSLIATPAEDRTLIAELLSLGGIDQRYPVLDLTPQIRKERTLNALVGQLEALAHHQPVLMIFEDVHWIDPTSLELLDRIVERLRTFPVLLLVTFRPEFAAPWVGQPHVTALMLRRLGMHDSAALAGHVSGNDALSAELLNEIVSRADGVPLFLEELTKAVVEAEPGENEEVVATVPSAAAAIPATLQASLISRLDRLGSAKEIAQIGAVIGREFSFELLRALTGWTETRLAAALDQLVASELVSRRGVSPATSYVFKHALVQEAAHETLLRAERRRLHARIADLLETSSGTAEREPETLAHHFTEAGLAEQAVRFRTKAAQKAAGLCSHVEATAHIKKALDFLEGIPDITMRRRAEFELQLTFGSVLTSATGPAVPEHGEAYDRARQLGEELGDPARLVRAMGGQIIHQMHVGKFLAARRVGEELLALDDQHEDPSARAVGRLMSGLIFFLQGKLQNARSEFEECIALGEPVGVKAVALLGLNPVTLAPAYLATVLFLLGHIDRARVLISSVVDKESGRNHAATEATALVVAWRFYWLSGNFSKMNDLADILDSIISRHGFSYLRAHSEIYQGWIWTTNGMIEQGLKNLQGGLKAYRATRAVLWLPVMLVIAATAYQKTNQQDDAIVLLNEAAGIIARYGERWIEPELERLQGEITTKKGDLVGAEKFFQKAGVLAGKQEAKLWKLRAATSLARLWRDTGRRSKASDLLAPVYGSFTEGFDAPDLKEAKTLLDDLV